ncbi:hypothetical protein ACXYMX_03905 [Sporosarcina sp. CAU 1771]
MINWTTLPSSTANPYDAPSSLNKGLYFSSTEAVATFELTKELRTRILALEQSADIHREELASIKKETDGLRFAIEEKEDLLLRLNWIRGLYDVNAAISTIDCKEEAETLSGKLKSLPRYPLKEQLVKEVAALIESLPSKDLEETAFDKLTEQAFIYAGDTFLNLGKTGRDVVLANVYEKYQGQAAIEHIQQQAKMLEEAVARLSGIKESERLVLQLEKLPLATFGELSDEVKGQIAEKLILSNEWQGLAELQRRIIRLSKDNDLPSTPLNFYQQTLSVSVGDGKVKIKDLG